MQPNPRREGHRDAKDPEEKTVFQCCLHYRDETSGGWISTQSTTRFTIVQPLVLPVKEMSVTDR
jgi:hypothetical protein